jgi:hypothetical protein
MDDAWIEEDGDSLAWWPSSLATQIYARVSGLWDEDVPDDNYLLITADTAIASLPEDLGIETATDANARFPFGAAIWEDGVLRLTTSLSLNPENRPMLSLFHEAVLAQAALASTLADELDGRDGVTILASAPNEGAPRTDCDELLGIYSGDEYGLPVVDGFHETVNEARGHLRGIMAEQGWDNGFSNDEVDFFTHQEVGMEVGVGFRPDEPISHRYGPGLFVLVRLLPPGTAFEPWLANDANQIVSRLEFQSQLGPILGEPTATAYGGHLRAYLPCGFLAEHRLDPQRLAITIANCVVHDAVTVKGFRDVAFES